MKLYRTPNAFKQALKSKVKERARQSGRPFNRMLQIVLFERFLARVYAALGDAVILKGGFAMELRMQQARTTRDIDMRVEGDINELVEDLRKAVTKQGKDYLTFDLSDEADFEEMLGGQVAYGGRRIKVRAMLAGQAFGDPFRLDLAVADRLLLPADRVLGTDIFGFIGIEPIEHRVYPEETHVAEKLHALTLKYDNGPSSRAKDLVDIGLLASHERFNAGRLRQSLAATFEFRDTHELPAALPTPPSFWSDLYKSMLLTDDLPWKTLDELHSSCANFLNPLLDDSLNENHYWSPQQINWKKENE